MRFAENSVHLTFSEADWIARERNLDRSLRTRTEQARRAALSPFLPEGTYLGIPELNQDAERKTFVRKVMADTAAHEAVKNHGFDEQGNELHMVTLTMETLELVAVYGRAVRIHAAANDIVMNFTEYKKWAADENPGPALSEAEQDSEDEAAFQENLGIVQVTTGIIRALAALRRAN